MNDYSWLPNTASTLIGGHHVPAILLRRLISPECRNGYTTCTDPRCLCGCHEPTRDDIHMRRIIDALDVAYWLDGSDAA